MAFPTIPAELKKALLANVKGIPIKYRALNTGLDRQGFAIFITEVFPGLSANEAAQLTTLMYEYADANNDGLLDALELRNIVSIVKDLPVGPIKKKRGYANLTAAMNEILKEVPPMPVTSRKSVLTKTDLRVLFNTWFPNPKEAQKNLIGLIVDSIYEAADTDENGKLSFVELAQYISIAKGRVPNS